MAYKGRPVVVRSVDRWAYEIKQFDKIRGCN